MNNVFLSFIKLDSDIKENYTKSKSGWKQKFVAWEDMRKVMSSSKVQYSNFSWKNGYKTANNFSKDNLTHLIWDIDDGLSIADFQRMFKKYRWVLGTTKSNMIDKKGVICERYRVVIEVINISSDIDVFFRAITLIAPFVDIQTLTKTAAYLGHTGAVIIYNNGKPLDLFKANELASEQLSNEEADRLARTIDPDLLPSMGNFSLQNIKENLTFEIVVEVLERVGYEVHANKFRIRGEERTMSATINYKTLTIKDYGSGWFGDIFAVLMEYQNMTFSQAIKFVGSYV